MAEDGNIALSRLGESIASGNFVNSYNNIIVEHSIVNAPLAYLNILVFNNNMELIPASSRRIRVSGGSLNNWEAIRCYNCVSDDIAIEAVPDGGYVLMTINNNTIGKDVWFDDIDIIHQPSKVIEENHYYPFGLTISNVAAGSVEQPHKYQGNELEKHFGLETMDFHARQYDPQLGRFNSVDLLADLYIGISPYAFTANNPIRFREVDGRYFEEGSKSVKQANKIEKQAEKQADKLERQANKLDAKGESVGDLRDRITELRQSAQDVRDMRNDQSIEYKYARFNGKEGKLLKLLGPSTTLTGQNGKGDNVVTMFTEKNMGNQIHETRHGGQNARGEFNVSTGAGYGVNDEVSAYRAQYSWGGNLKYMSYTDFSNNNNLMQMMTQGIQSFIQNIININQITPNIINTFVDNPGFNQILIYPPPSIPLNIWNSN